MPIIVHSTYHPSPNGPEEGHVTFKCDFSDPDGHFWPRVPYYEVSMHSMMGPESGWLTTCCIVVSHKAVLGRYALVVRRTLLNRLWFWGYKLAQKVRDLDYSLLYGMFKLGILDVPENTWIMHWWDTLPSFSLNPETMSRRVTERNNEEREWNKLHTTGPVHLTDPLYIPMTYGKRATDRLLNEPGADPLVSSELATRYQPEFAVEDAYDALIRRLSAEVVAQSDAVPYTSWLPPVIPPDPYRRQSNWSWSHHRHPFSGQGMGSDDERGYIDRGYDGRS